MYPPRGEKQGASKQSQRISHHISLVGAWTWSDFKLQVMDKSWEIHCYARIWWCSRVCWSWGIEDALSREWQTCSAAVSYSLYVFMFFLRVHPPQTHTPTSRLGGHRDYLIDVKPGTKCDTKSDATYSTTYCTEVVSYLVSYLVTYSVASMFPNIIAQYTVLYLVQYLYNIFY